MALIFALSFNGWVLLAKVWKKSWHLSALTVKIVLFALKIDFYYYSEPDVVRGCVRNSVEHFYSQRWIGYCLFIAHTIKNKFSAIANLSRIPNSFHELIENSPNRMRDVSRIILLPKLS